MVLDKREAVRMANAARSGWTLAEYAEKTRHTRLRVLEGQAQKPEIPMAFDVDRKWRGEMVMRERELEAQRKWDRRKQERKRSRKRFFEDMAGALSTLGATACCLVILMGAESNAVKWVAFLAATLSTVGAFGFAKKMDEESRRECWK